MRAFQRATPAPVAVTNRRVLLPALGLAFVLSGALAFAGPDLPVNTDNFPTEQQQEVDIAVDASGGDLVCVYIEDPRWDTGASVSHDGGFTWNDYQLQFGCNAKDDDGDGTIDEEWCDGLDNDLDTLVDEDVCCQAWHIDPAVTSDDAGNFTTIAIAYEPNATSYLGSSYVVVHRSTDGGVTWSELPPADSSPWGPDNVAPFGFRDNADFLDKCWIVADHTPGPYSGHVYAAWQRDTANDCDQVDNDFPPDGRVDEELCNGVDDDIPPDGRIDEDNCCLRTLANTRVYVSRWDTGTLAWTGPVQIDDVPANECNFIDEDGDGQMDEELCNGLDDDGDGLFDEDLCCRCSEAPTPVVASSGRVYVVWRRNEKFCGFPAQFFVDYSDDGGATWQTDLPGPTYDQIDETLRNHIFRTSDFPVIEVHPHNPSVLFVVYAEDPPGPDQADAMFTWSANAGTTWSTPMRINTDTTNTPQYWPTLTVQPGSFGNAILDITWYDQRNSVGCDGIDNDLPPDGRIDEELPNGIDDDGDGAIDEDVCDVRIDVYWARAVDDGTWSAFTTPNLRVTDLSFQQPTGTNFLGDYLGIDSVPGLDSIAWVDTRGGDNDIFFDTMPDMDSDADGAADLSDCAPANGLVWAAPQTVSGLQVSKIALSTNVTVSWTSQDPACGTGTGYDIVSGRLSHLRSDGNYSRASCLVNQHPDTPYTDTRGNPPVGDGHYYLARASNVCGDGGYGTRPAPSGNTPCPVL